MSRYVHRHTLHTDDANLHPRGSERAQVIRAGFALGALAHAGESRKKINPTIDYISHPIMAYDMLCELGETDVALLAAAFLHDVLELDHYRDDPDRLRRELEEMLEKEGMSGARAEKLASEIYGLVYEVTNPEVLPKAKELFQIDHTEEMSLRAKKLKIVDQCASFACNLLLDNDPEEIPYEKERGFKEKGEALCHAILESAHGNETEMEALKPYAAFFQRCLTQVNKLFLQPDATEHEILRQRMETRHHFHFYELFTGPTKVAAPLPVSDTSAEKLCLYDLEDLPDELESGQPLGLLQVEYDEKGCVNKFYLHVSPDPSKSNQVNQLQQKFTAEIREKLRWAGLYGETGKDVVQPAALLPGHLAIDANVRLYRILPAMPHDAFAAAARNAEVCSKVEAGLIARTGARLKSEHVENMKAKKPMPKPRVAEVDEKEARLQRLSRRSWDTPGR